MTQQEINELVVSAQQGNEEAKNLIVKTMIESRYVNRVYRFMYMNRLLRPDEVRSEFWFGVAQALPKAKAIGDPLHYLAQCGVWQVVSALRHRIHDGVTFACVVCGRHGSLTQSIRARGCPRCESRDIVTQERNLAIDDTNPARLAYERRPDDIITVFRGRLHGRELQVFDLIINGLDRDSVNNYLLEIAHVLGISSPCVSAYLTRIRAKLRKFLLEKP